MDLAFVHVWGNYGAIFTTISLIAKHIENLWIIFRNYVIIIHRGLKFLIVEVQNV